MTSSLIVSSGPSWLSREGGRTGSVVGNLQPGEWHSAHDVEGKGPSGVLLVPNGLVAGHEHQQSQQAERGTGQHAADRTHQQGLLARLRPRAIRLVEHAQT